jgi:polysaccharide biosynthesis protein PslJ
MSQIPTFGNHGRDRSERHRPDHPGRSEHRELHEVVRGSLGWAAVVLVGMTVGVAANSGERLALALGALLLIFGIFVADPIVLAVLVLPGSLLLQRVGGASTNLSVADLLVFMGALVCLFQVRWSEAPFLRQFFRGILWYQAILILVVLADPNRYDIVEWFHRLSYLGGSVLVGWTIANYGRARPALRLFLWGSSVLALISIEQAFATHFQPAQWGGYQKNSIGAVMWVAVVVAQLRPAWTGLGRTEARIAKYVCFAGLLASQSRQAIISLILAIAVATFLNPDVRRRSKMVLLGCLPLVVALYYSFSLAARDNPKFNSVAIRFSQIGDALNVWHQSPLLGKGMRFYDLPQYLSVTAPPNVVIDNLASTGIVGSLAFCYLVYMTMSTMNRLPRAFGTLGLVILLGHYVDGLFDIFWIGANMIPPLLIAGMSLGVADADREDRLAAGSGSGPALPRLRASGPSGPARTTRSTTKVGSAVSRAHVVLTGWYQRPPGLAPVPGAP